MSGMWYENCIKGSALKWKILNLKIIFIVVFLYKASSQNLKQDSLKITLIYRPTCHYCKEFITDQFYKTWETFKDKIEWEVLIGFGEKLKTRCKHSPNLLPCVLNELHMCAIYVACGKQGTLGCPLQNLSRAMEFIYCMEKENTNKWYYSKKKCALAAKLDQKFQACKSKKLLSKLWESHFQRGQIAESYPYISFNNMHNETEEDHARDDFKSVICKYIPAKC